MGETICASLINEMYLMYVCIYTIRANYSCS